MRWDSSWQEWWIFFSVLIIDNLWNLRSFTDKDGVEGSSAHLMSKLCSSSLGDLGSIGVPQMKKVGNTGVQSVSPFSRLLRWCRLPKKDCHSCPNVCFFFEPLWRWVTHFLKRWKQMSFQSPQIRFHWKQSPICLVMDCLLIPTNGTSWLISLGCSPQRNTKQINKHDFLRFLLKCFHFNFRSSFCVEFSSSETR